jgi:hypothetical protein
LATRLLAPALLALFCILAAGCESAGPKSGGAEELAPEATTSTTPRLTPAAEVIYGEPWPPGGVARRALAEISPQGAAQVRYFSGCCLGIAVYFPSENVIYEVNGNQRFELASVGKLAITLTMIDSAESSGRELTPEELGLIEAMMTASDNDAAEVAWNLAGGAKAVSRLLLKAGLYRPEIKEENWGTIELSAVDAVELLGAVVDGGLLGDEGQALVLGMMSRVVPWQAWGVALGAPAAAQAGVKNGWYPEPEGWLINSLGYVVPEDGPPYVLAVFSLGVPNYFNAIAEVEVISRLLHLDIAANGLPGPGVGGIAEGAEVE